jgi:hypothetical protein
MEMGTTQIRRQCHQDQRFFLESALFFWDQLLPSSTVSLRGESELKGPSCEEEKESQLLSLRFQFRLATGTIVFPRHFQPLSATLDDWAR